MRRSGTTNTDHTAESSGSRAGFLWSLGGGLLASFCCVGPLVAVLIAGGGAAGAVGLIRFKLEFIAIGLLVTLIGVALTLRRTKACCSVKTYRRNRILIPAVSLTVFAVMVVGSNALLLNDRVIEVASGRLTDQTEQMQWVAIEPTVPMIAHTTTAPATQSPDLPQATQAPSLDSTPVGRQLDVAITDGVWCAGCLLAIEEEVLQTPGVQDLWFVKEASSSGYFVIRIFYNPDQVDTSTLLRVITEAPGAVGGKYGAEVVADEPAS